MLPIAPARTAEEVIRRASLVELRGGAPARHPTVTLEPLAGAILVRGLRPGDYRLRAPGISPHDRASQRRAPRSRGSVVTPGEVVELSRDRAPAIAELLVDDALHVTLTRRDAAHARARDRDEVRSRGRCRDVSSTAGRGDSRVDRARGAPTSRAASSATSTATSSSAAARQRFPALLLDKPSLLLNPWSRRTTSTDVADARGRRRLRSCTARRWHPGVRRRREAARGRRAADDEAYVGYDFVAAAARRDREPRARRRRHARRSRSPSSAARRRSRSSSTIRPARSSRHVALPEHRARAAGPAPARRARSRSPRDAAQGDRTAARRRSRSRSRISRPRRSTSSIRSSARTRYLLALREDATLREFDVRHALARARRRASAASCTAKYACHELHLFLYFKDRAFFDAVVQPYLAHKRMKTFLDHWLLGARPVALPRARRCSPRLNAVERALLAQRLRAETALARMLADEVAIAAARSRRATRASSTRCSARPRSTATRRIAGDAGTTRIAARDDAARRAEHHAGSGGRRRARTAAPGAPGQPATKMRSARARTKIGEGRGGRGGAGRIRRPRRRLSSAAARPQRAMFRAADKTQEWAENNWWHRTPGRERGRA